VPLLIRPMFADDVPAVCEVDALCIRPPWAPETFAAEVSSTLCYYRVAEVEGRIVGYLGSHVIIDEAHVTTFGVHPDYRGRRIGERLLADMLSHAVRSGCERITLEVRAGNVEAQGLYRKYGFSPVSLRKRYYADEEDAVVMWIEDTTRAGFRTLLTERLAALQQRGGLSADYADCTD
jgi:[ribosomal protein S18]-alanine N-acetyltransferase